MAKRVLTNQPINKSGELVPIQRGPAVTRLPLLPYEKQLIHTLGWSEEEYRFFQDEISKRNVTRPAAYDHIPDVQAGPVVPILVNLVIGLALTALSTLLAPKPKEPKKTEQKRLGDLTGPSRFNSTFGFDSIADLAQYGKPVAIPFGFFEDRDSTGSYTGGIVATPSLVWSRMLSYGTYQIIKAMYVVGEGEVGYPTTKGTWVGNNTIDALFESKYALYWRTNDASGRILTSDKIAGTGDPVTASGEAFLCPTSASSNDTGFSMAYTPSNQTTFGIFGSIPNGTGLKVNWRVVSIPDNIDDDDRLRSERSKICGHDSRMKGFGRMYGRKQGLVKLTRADGSVETPTNRQEYQINVGDRVDYLISNKTLPEDYYPDGVTVNDINNVLEQEHIAADEELQLGELFIIGKSVWKVVNRPNTIWNKETNITVTLECLEVGGIGNNARQIGIPGEPLVNAETMNFGEPTGPGDMVQANFYNLLRFSEAVVRNQRPCDCTEIGIRSKVWLKFNGLCNFNEVPTADQLEEYDDDDVNVSNGNMSLNSTRYSFFSLLARPAGDDDTQEWIAVGGLYAIKGTRPVDQFNYIRIKSFTRTQWEFRLVPRSGAYVTRKTDDTTVAILNAAANTLVSDVLNTIYGALQVEFTGEEQFIRPLEPSPLMYGVGETEQLPINGTITVPTSLSLSGYQTPTTDGQAHGYRYQVFGNPASYNAGHTRTVARTLQKGGTQPIFVRAFFTSTVIQLGSSNRWGQNKVWSESQVTPNLEHPDTTGGWATGQGAINRESISGDNPYLGAYAGNTINGVYAVTASQVNQTIPGKPGRTGVEFESDTQIIENSYYGDLIQRSCDSAAEHAVVYVNESISYVADGNNDADSDAEPQYYNMTTMGLVLHSTRQFTSLDQPRVWLPRGVKVTKLLPSATPEESSNNYADLVYHLLTSDRSGVGDLINEELVDIENMKLTAQFIQTNRLFYDGALEERINVRSFISDTAALMLCNFVIRNGKFSLIPAVPTDNAGNIITRVEPKALFTEGNIVDGSFELDYLELEERQNFQAEMTFRRGYKNQLPEQRNVVVRYSGVGSSENVEAFDMSAFCTRRGHAAIVARYFLALRKHVDHTISFQSDPLQLSGVRPGDYIKVMTQSNPYFPKEFGVISSADLSVTSINPIADGEYRVTYYKPELEGIAETTLTILDGRATDATLAGTIFTVYRDEGVVENIYQVEQLTLNEDTMVDIVASYFPVDENGESLIVKDMQDLDAFVTFPE